MCLDVEVLGFASLAEVEVGTISAAVSNTTDGYCSASVALAATVNVGAAPSIVLGNAKQEVDDILAGPVTGVPVSGSVVVPPVVISNL